MKIIKDLWILQDTGIVVFHRVYHEVIDVNLFGGFMSALNAYAGVLVEGGLSSFDLEKKKFTLYKQNGYIFLASTSRKIKDNKVVEELKKVADKFFITYPQEFLDSWRGDVSAFSNFEYEIETSLQQLVKKFQQAFW